MSFPSVTLEIAFGSDPIASTPTWTDCTDALMSFEIKRGRQWEMDTVQAGYCTFVLDNSDRRFDPTFSGSPFYPNVLPRRRMRISATFGGITYYVFNGFIDKWPPTYSRPDWSSVQVTAYDAFAALNKANIVGTFTQELAGSRIARALEAGGWASSTPSTTGWRLGTSHLGVDTILGYGIPTSVLDPGVRQIQDTTFVATDNRSAGTSALTHILAVADSDLGVCFIDGQGRVIFHDGHHRMKLASSVTLTDASTSTSRLNYSGDPGMSFDALRLANDVAVTRNGGVTQATSDAASIGEFFRATLSKSPLLASDAESFNMAAYLLATYKDAPKKVRFDNVTVEGHFDDNAWPHVLGREISDRVTVEFTPPSTPPYTFPYGYGVYGLGVYGFSHEQIVRDCYIESITHKVEPPVLWETTYQLSPAITATPWLLGTSRLGVDTALTY